jgi:transketolase
MIRHRLVIMLFSITLTFTSLSAFAAVLAFEQLSPREQVLLLASKTIWSKLDQPTQAQLRSNVTHWQRLPAAQQTKLLAQQKKWDAQPADVKLNQRVRWYAWQRMGNAEQTKIKAAMARYQAMTPQQQQQLRAQFSGFSQAYQQQWWLGADLGRDALMLESWLRFVPDAQREAWLELLRELNPEQRFTLKKYGDRANAAQRDTLRTRLLSAPKDARAEMINNASR